MEPPKISVAEILKKAQDRSLLRYQGFLRPPTAWVEDPQTKFLTAAFPGLQVLETGRPPQPPPASGTVGGGPTRKVSSGGVVGGGAVPMIPDEDMGQSSQPSGRPQSSTIDDYESMGGMPSGTVRAPVEKRKRLSEDDGEGNPMPSKRPNTRVPFDANHPFWTQHDVNPLNVTRTPRQTFPDPSSTHAHPLRVEGPSSSRQPHEMPATEASMDEPEPSNKRKATRMLRAPPAKVSKPSPTAKRKASAISPDLLRPDRMPSQVQKKQKASIQPTVRERAAALDRATASPLPTPREERAAARAARKV